MRIEDLPGLVVEQKALSSVHLNRYVIIDIYLPKYFTEPSALSLLLINDGQNLEEMNFAAMLDQLMSSTQIEPLMCVGIHAGTNRKNEYGTARIPDYGGRGQKSEAYNRFVLDELLPFLHIHFGIEQFRQKAFAGFSLGGLSALDMVWHYPHMFNTAGVFSGSLWWRSRDLGEGYNDLTDRIMHQQIRKGSYKPGLRFYFTTGSMDETADRNQNGIIDSIDDTLDLIEELKRLGYNTAYDIRYINYEDGKHDIPTWGRAMPHFLLWGWGRAEKSMPDNEGS